VTLDGWVMRVGGLFECDYCGHGLGTLKGRVYPGRRNASGRAKRLRPCENLIGPKYKLTAMGPAVRAP